jgi:NAD(P)-dependent dehydrogenase (short-subunit alcohol dehydrogenase family)
MLSSEGLSEALVQEVASPGIRVTIVEPGEFRTDFAGRSLVRAHREIAGYAQTSGATRKQLAQVNGVQEDQKRLPNWLSTIGERPCL